MLTEMARMRIEAISFFGMCVLACAWIVQRAWDRLRRDLPRLPELSFDKSVGLMILGGLLFFLALTTISGARDLLTSGAPARPVEPLAADPTEPARTVALERLRAALWTYSRGHGGHLPPDDRVAEIPEELWSVPDPSGLRYVYEGGREIGRGASPVAYEPGIYGPTRLVLLSNGEVRRMTLAEIRDATSRRGPR